MRILQIAEELEALALELESTAWPDLKKALELNAENIRTRVETETILDQVSGISYTRGEIIKGGSRLEVGSIFKDPSLTRPIFVNFAARQRKEFYHFVAYFKTGCAGDYLFLKENVGLSDKDIFSIKSGGTFKVLSVGEAFDLWVNE